jgi:hypothetical protein
MLARQHCFLNPTPPTVARDILNRSGLWLAKTIPPPKAYVPRAGHDARYTDDDQLQTNADTIYDDPESAPYCL